MAAEFTRHARDALRKREILEEWVQRVLQQPQKIEADRLDPSLEHRMLPIVEKEDRVLRIIVNRTVSPERIITAYFDRKLKGKL